MRKIIIATLVMVCAVLVAGNAMADSIADAAAAAAAAASAAANVGPITIGPNTANGGAGGGGFGTARVTNNTPVGIPTGVAPLISSGTSIAPTDIRPENCRILSYEEAATFSEMLDPTQLKHVFKAGFRKQSAAKIVLSAPVNGTLVGAGAAIGKEGDTLLSLYSLVSKDTMDKGGNVVVLKRVLERTGTLTNGSSTTGGAGIGANILNVVSLGFFGSKTKGNSVVSSNGVYVVEADYYRVEGLEMACGEPTLPPAPPVATPVPPQQVCNPSSFIERLKYYAQEIIWCLYRCLNNEKLRFERGTLDQDIYYCEGKVNKQWLKNAIYDFEVGERDFRLGRELAPGQKPTEKPKGVYTKTLPEAQMTMQKMFWNWSLAIRELNGPQAQYDFAKLHPDAFRGADGKLHVPTCEADMKH